MKKYNRRCELKLRDAELLLSVALTHNRIPIVDIEDLRAKVNEGWRLLLVNQFHDVLPGSSIELAHTEAKQWFHKSVKLAEEITNRCINYLASSSQQPKGSANSLINTLPWPRQALVYQDEIPTGALIVHSMSCDSQQLQDIQPVTLGNNLLIRLLLNTHVLRMIPYRASGRNLQGRQ